MNRICTAFEQSSWAPLGLGGSPPAGLAVGSGFSWAYLDLIGDDGRGVVLILAYGLPFVPGTVAAGRRGDPVDPSHSPSVCLATYEDGRCTCYVLQELAPDSVGGGRWGRSTLSTHARAVRVTLDLDVPGGERLVGEVEIEGPTLDVPVGGASAHRWQPHRVGPGRASLRSGSWAFSAQGRGYHDGNTSSVGIHELGIQRWLWGRVPHPDGDRVYYAVEPVDAAHGAQVHLLGLGLDGRVEHREAAWEPGADARGWWGLPAPRTFRVGDLSVRHARALEDGPFYQRWEIVAVGADGVARAGVGEVVDVERMDRGPFGPLVQMAVGRRAGGSSIWLPLFCGPHAGRFSRLVRSWTHR